MFWRGKTLDESYSELDRDSMRAGIAKDYESISHHASDNEYLYYLNHKVAFTNQRLYELKTLVQIQTIVIALGAMAIFYKSELWPF